MLKFKTTRRIIVWILWTRPLTSAVLLNRIASFPSFTARGRRSSQGGDLLSQRATRRPSELQRVKHFQPSSLQPQKNRLIIHLRRLVRRQQTFSHASHVWRHELRSFPPTPPRGPECSASNLQTSTVFNVSGVLTMLLPPPGGDERWRRSRFKDGGG